MSGNHQRRNPEVSRPIRPRRFPPRRNNNQRQNTNQRNNAEQRHYRQSILRLFRCPFKDESTCRFVNSPERCNFSHCSDNESLELQKIPSYVCIYNLLHSCNNPTPENCRNGLHLNIEDMLDLDLYREKNQSAIDTFYGEDINRECMICFEKVVDKCVPDKRRFGILEKCAHVFCESCIVTWRNRSHECPVCRMVSNRLIIRHKFLDDVHAKQIEFSRVRSRPSRAPGSVAPLSLPANLEFLSPLNRDFWTLANVILNASDSDSDSDYDYYDYDDQILADLY